MTPSVLILSEDLTFLLSCYSALQQDPRIGRIEAITTRQEAEGLLQTFRPDAVVIDSSFSDSAGLASVVQNWKLPRETVVIVTCRDGDRAQIVPEARSAGAVALLSRERFSSLVVLRAVGVLPGNGSRTGTAAGARRSVRPTVTPS